MDESVDEEKRGRHTRERPCDGGEASLGEATAPGEKKQSPLNAHTYAFQNPADAGHLHEMTPRRAKAAAVSRRAKVLRTP